MSTGPARLEHVRGSCYAWLQPDGGWGLSNAGLITGRRESLLVDTLFDLAHTRRMLAGMGAALASAPVTTVINTHGNGDHWFGNELVGPDARIIAAAATVGDMQAVGPEALRALVGAPGQIGAYGREIFGRFDFTSITPRYPDFTYEREHTETVGGTDVLLIDVGPAHTAGDTVVFCERDRVVFTGDILFAGGTPVMWQGPVDNWLRACRRILALGAEVAVPGHGPVCPVTRVRDMADYLDFIREQAARSYQRGMPAQEAALGIDLGRFAGWPEAERLAVNVATVYRELAAVPGPPPSGPELFGCMAELSARRHSGSGPAGGPTGGE